VGCNCYCTSSFVKKPQAPVLPLRVQYFCSGCVHLALTPVACSCDDWLLRLLYAKGRLSSRQVLQWASILIKSTGLFEKLVIYPSATAVLRKQGLHSSECLLMTLGSSSQVFVVMAEGCVSVVDGYLLVFVCLLCGSKAVSNSTGVATVAP